VLVFHGNFSSNEHCTKFFCCFNLFVYTRNLATLKWLGGYKFERKNISQKGSSVENNGRFLKRTKITMNTASNKALMGFKFSSNEHCTNHLFFVFCAWNTALLALSLDHNFSLKKSQEKAAPIRPLVLLLLQETLQGPQKPIYWHCCTIFAITRKPLKLRAPVRYCKSFFTD